MELLGNNRLEAQEYADRMLKAHQYADFYEALRGWILVRLQLECDEAEEDLLSLCAFSIKRIAAGNAGIHELVDKYDCHQTSVMVRKKVLLIMALEKLMGIRFDDDTAHELDTVTLLAQAAFVEYRGKEVKQHV
ncbi:MAG: hypothetical protein ACOX8S_08425 [Christensenellales bacterium]